MTARDVRLVDRVKKALAEVVMEACPLLSSTATLGKSTPVTPNLMALDNKVLSLPMACLQPLLPPNLVFRLRICIAHASGLAVAGTLWGVSVLASATYTDLAVIR